MHVPIKAGRAAGRTTSTAAWPIDFGPLVILAVFLFLGLLIGTVPVEEVVPALFYLPVVFMLAQLTYSGVARAADGEMPRAAFWLAFLLKLSGTVAYYWVVHDVYGRGDVNTYHYAGQQVSESLARLDFSILGTYFIGRQSSTNIVLLNGIVYTLLPVSWLGSGMLFSTLSFIGSAFFYRAFRLALPDGNSRFYLLTVFFLPSMLFWTSAVGKDAWIFFGSGFVAYGLARYAREARWSGLLLAGVGMGIVYLARPHFTAFMILAAGVAFMLFYRVTSARRLVVWLAGAAVIVVAGIFVLRSATEFLGLGDLSEISWAEVEEFYEFRQDVSAGGGGGFAATTTIDPMGLLSAPVVVLLRPFVWEAHNTQSLLAALESMVWLGLFWWRRKILWRRLLSIRRDPWVAFALGYTAIMIVAMTTSSNFGIIARQRVTLLPFLWVLFA